ncbi:MAG TPA: hypothetical protein VEQ10_06960 [Vicinamibacteria bacterium]|nr:hypothetical protein [Vicinamibacteria bacterium]
MGSPDPRASRGAADPAALSEAGGGEERRLGGSPHAAAANAAVLALTRAARSFTLYDPANRVVRTLISDYRDKLERVLSGFGALVLEVHPFELLLGREVVYVEKDRERSLAFRLFRDGVRQIAFQPGATWTELLTLLQILSIRFSGVRQQEDDLVTLLRKADFAHISTRAIEGFVPEEEDAEPPLGGRAGPGQRQRREPPGEWDLPLPPFRETVPLRHRPVPPALVEELRSEESAESVPAEALHAVLEVWGGMPPDERALGFALEVRDFLLVEKRVGLVLDLVAAAARTAAQDPAVAGRFLASYLDLPTLKVLLAPESHAPAAQLAQLLAGAPIETQSLLLDLLTGEADDSRAEMLHTIVAGAFKGAPQQVAARFLGAQGPTALVLYRLLVEVDPGTALRHADNAAQRPDPTLQLEALAQLAAAPVDLDTARVLRKLLDSSDADVRLAALPVTARGGERAFPLLRAYAEKRVGAMADGEAEAVGQALAQASAHSALGLFEAWLAVRSGWLGRAARVSAPLQLQLASVAGLRLIRGPEAASLLERLARGGHALVAPMAASALRSGSVRRG